MTRSARRSRAVLAGLVGVVIAAIAVVWVTSQHSQHHPPAITRPSPPTVPTTPAQFFAPDSIWNRALPADAPLAPNSASVVAGLEQQVDSEATGIATASYGTRIYTVGANQPTVHVSLVEITDPALQKAFDAVPIPKDARPAPGTDGYLVVYQPSTDTMWEFWKASRDAGGHWTARWGGRMLDVSTNPGYYRNIVDPAGQVLEQATWGAPATSLPLVGGTMLISELRAGTINHALALLVHDTCAGEWSFPAQRTDGNMIDDPSCIPEGAHFRLDPNLNLASLHLPHFVYMMAVAAQRYGVIVDDRTAGVGFRAEDPAQFEARYGYNPYFGRRLKPGTAGALFNKWPAQLVHDFPWSHLQLLTLDLRDRPDKTEIVQAAPTG
jgi:hypothetical protein